MKSLVDDKLDFGANQLDGSAVTTRASIENTLI